METAQKFQNDSRDEEFVQVEITFQLQFLRKG